MIVLLGLQSHQSSVLLLRCPHLTALSKGFDKYHYEECSQQNGLHPSWEDDVEQDTWKEGKISTPHKPLNLQHQSPQNMAVKRRADLC